MYVGKMNDFAKAIEGLIKISQQGLQTSMEEFDKKHGLTRTPSYGTSRPIDLPKDSKLTAARKAVSQAAIQTRGTLYTQDSADFAGAVQDLIEKTTQDMQISNDEFDKAHGLGRYRDQEPHQEKRKY